MKTMPLDDLELYELMVAAYPDRFDEENDGDEQWDEVMDFMDNFAGCDDLADLLGRVVMLTMPMTSPLSGRVRHCLGTVRPGDEPSKFVMTAAVSRDVEEQ